MPANEKKAQAIKLITEIGPQITEIASRIGVHKETVRYWYHSLLERGFTVQASYDFEKLGMKRISMVVDLAEAYSEFARALFMAMNSLCYVVGYERTILDGSYLLHASVPAEHVDDYINLMQKLKEKDLFRSLDHFQFDSFRNIPMRADKYNFENGFWDFDWSSAVPNPEDVAMPPPSNKSKFDYIDLLILQELRIDANRSLVEVQENLKKNNIDVNYKTLDWHYRTHVLGDGLIKSYVLNWMGTRYDFKLEKAMHKKHTYLRVDLFVRDVNENERMTLMGWTNGIPFQWSEEVGPNYFAQFAFPMDNVTEALLYLEKAIAPVKERARYFIMDPTNALSFTIDPTLYDTEERNWRFDSEDLMARFEHLLLQTKSGIG